jgi:hypothetical protein
LVFAAIALHVAQVHEKKPAMISSCPVCKKRIFERITRIMAEILIIQRRRSVRKKVSRVIKQQ